MANYKQNPNCPVCQHADREKIDALLAFQHKGRVNAPGHVASQFAGLSGGEIAFHDAQCLYPSSDTPITVLRSRSDG